MSQKNRHDVKVSYQALLPLIEALLCDSTREARLSYAKELGEKAFHYRVLGFTFAGGHGLGFGDDDAKSPDWQDLDATGELTRVLEQLQRAAVFKFWAQFLRDPAGVLWRQGGDGYAPPTGARYRMMKEE